MIQHEIGLAGFGAQERQAVDPWQHRAANMRCRTCMYYEGYDLLEQAVLKREVGRCRRHAPTMSGFPAVFPNDWCGDHKIDEGRI